MKLPVQAAAVVRESRSAPAWHPSRFGGAVPAVEPAGCQLCKHGPNPCKGSASNMVTCASGTCQCCAPGQSGCQAPGGACVCA